MKTPEEIIDDVLAPICTAADTTNGVFWSDRLKMREAIIGALDAAGYAIVPKEPTDKMLEEVTTSDIEWPGQMLLPVSAAEDIYRAMIVAAQKENPPSPKTERASNKGI